MAHQDEEAERRLTKDQCALGEGVRTLLRRLRVAYTESLEGTSDESWYRFQIRTPPGSRLQVGIAVVGDVVVFEANGVELRWDLEAWGGDGSPWIAGSLDGLAIVFENDLRIRVRPTLFGTAGAIWFPGSRGEGAWHGDSRAARGRGREYIFPRIWYLQD